MEKVCPACGKDLPPTAVRCDNGSCPNPMAVARSAARPKERKPDNKGSGGPRINPHESVIQGVPVNKVFVPGVTPVVAQGTSLFNKPNNKVITSPKKPIKNKAISDDDTVIVDDEHLRNCEMSANNLGL